MNDDDDDVDLFSSIKNESVSSPSSIPVVVDDNIWLLRHIHNDNMMTIWLLHEALSKWRQCDCTTTIRGWFDCCISGESYVAWRSPNNDDDDMMTMRLLRKRRVGCGLACSTSWQWWRQCDCCVVVMTSILQQCDCCMTTTMMMMWLLHQQISSSSDNNDTYCDGLGLSRVMTPAQPLPRRIQPNHKPSACEIAHIP